MREMTLGQDSTFSFDLFKKRYNDDLANDLGNLLNRITILIRKFCDATVPSIINPDKNDTNLILQATELPNKCLKHIQDFKINTTIESIMEVIRSTNKYLEIKQPWKSLKSDKKNQSGLNALSISCETIAISAKLLYPVMPNKCEQIFNILDIEKNTVNELGFEKISGNKIKEHKALFPRIENDS